MIKKRKWGLLAIMCLCGALCACGNEEKGNNKTGSDGADDAKEAYAEYKPEKCQGWAEVPEVLLSLTGNESNAITVDCDYADSYQAVINSDYDGAETSLRIYGTVQKAQEKGAYGYKFSKADKIELNYSVLPDNFITILAMDGENVVGASFIHTHENGKNVCGELVETYRFDKADGKYQNVTEADLEKLRAEAFGKDRHYMTAEEMKLVQTAMPDEYSGDWIKLGDTLYSDYCKEADGEISNFAMKIKNDDALAFILEDVTKIEVNSQNTDICITGNKDEKADKESYSLDTADKYYLVSGDKEKAENLMEMRFYSNDRVVGYVLLAIEKEDDGYSVLVVLPASYEKDNGEYPKLSENYFDSLWEGFVEARSE